MPISGLVVTLSDDESQRDNAIATLEADERFTVGDRQDNHLPVVADTDTIDEGKQLLRDELMDVHGVIFVNVITVNFEDTTDGDRTDAG